MNKITQAFKHLFIPHKHNDYKPHFFREASVLVIAGCAVALIALSASSKLLIERTDMTAAVLPAVLVDLTNNARASNNESALTRNGMLDRAAQLKADDMALHSYFAHTSPAGVTPWHWFNEAGYTFSYAGENLAIDFTESPQVEDAWLRSPTHKANILNTKFTEIGIATADGLYQGHTTTFVVQMFGKPALASSQASVIPAKEKKEIVKPVETTTIALAPAVRGESARAVEKLETVADTKEFVAVKNTTIEPTAAQATIAPAHYSKWYERFVFLMPSYADRIYHILIWLVTIALLCLISIEIRRQHPKNIMYGVLTLVILISFIYINKAVFMNGAIT